MTGSTHYGSALFEITEECGSTERVLADIAVAKKLFSDSPEYVKLLDTPAVPKEERVELISASLGTLDTHLTNLIKILSEHHSTYLFCRIADDYSALYDKSRGIERVDAITAVPLTEAQKARLIVKLSALTGKKVKLKNTVDPSILGGMKIRYSDKQLDGSVRSRLDSFEAGLKDLVI